MPAADVGTELLPERQPHLGPQLARVGAAERAVAQDRALAAVVDDDLGPLRSDLACDDGRQRQLLGQRLEAVVGVEAGAGAASTASAIAREPTTSKPCDLSTFITSLRTSASCAPSNLGTPMRLPRRRLGRGRREQKGPRQQETSSETRATPLIGRPPGRDLRGPADDRPCAAAGTGFWRPWCLSSSFRSRSVIIMATSASSPTLSGRSVAGRRAG